MGLKTTKGYQILRVWLREAKIDLVDLLSEFLRWGDEVKTAQASQILSKTVKHLPAS